MTFALRKYENLRGLAWFHGNVSNGCGGACMSNSAKMSSPCPVTSGHEVYPSYFFGRDCPFMAANKLLFKTGDWAAAKECQIIK